MKISLDNAFDAHWAYVDKFHHTTFNIVIKVSLTISLEEKIITEACACLNKIHPQLTGKLVELNNQVNTVWFELKECGESPIKVQIHDCSDIEINETMNSISPRRLGRLDLYNGELLVIHVFRSEQNTVLEFTCPHLVGDISAVTFIVHDFLKLLDQLLGGATVRTQLQKRRMFDEVRYGWLENMQAPVAMDVSSYSSASSDIWPPPKFDYCRFHMSKEEYGRIYDWITKKNIHASVLDVFYFSCARLYKRLNYDIPNFTVVLSFRSLLDSIEKNNINTSALFSPVTITNLSNIKSITEFSVARKNLVNKESVINLINFLRNLNFTLSKCDSDSGRRLLNAILPLNVFAFNNLGRLDEYYSGFTHFTVEDIDIQDAAPEPEVRMYGFNDLVHVNPMLRGDVFTASDFWSELTREVECLMRE